MSRANPYCEALGIQVPRLEAAKDRPDANSYSLLIVALLERGEPITLEDAATELKAASLKDLCALGGWKDHNTILKCYQQPDPEAMRLALENRATLRNA